VFFFCFFVFRVCVGRSTYCHVRCCLTKLCGVCVGGAKIVYDCGVCEIVYDLGVPKYSEIVFFFCFFLFRVSVCVGRSTYCHVSWDKIIVWRVCVWGAKIVYDCGVCEIVYDLGVPKYIVRSCFSFVLFSSVSVLEEVRTAT